MRLIAIARQWPGNLPGKLAKFLPQIAVGIFCAIGLAGETLQAGRDSNPVLQVGIVQRFGENPQDAIEIEALDGDKLSLSFPSGDGKTQQVLTTDRVVLQISQQLQSEPQVVEKIVLSNHRSFENAAASAYRWQSLGIETEIGQPKRWQVWAKRDTYSTPVIRQLLLYNLRTQQGRRLVQLETETFKQRPLVSWVVGGFRYNRDRVEITTARGVVRANKRLYGGALHVKPNAYDSFTLVNRVPLETYLRGVVPHEIGYNAPFAAIQAQAVLARTYALASRHRFTIDGYELCADTQCQVYRGLEGTSDLADRAIASTQGKVLTFSNRVVDALYSSTTGGITADYNDIWDGEARPYLRSRLDSVSQRFDPKTFSLSDETAFRKFIGKNDGFNEVGWDAFRWKASSSIEEMKGTLREFLRLSGDTETRFNRIDDVSVVERAPSGRVLKMSVQTDANTIFLEKDEIIDAFYAPNSTLFFLQPQYQEVLPAVKGKPPAKVLKGYTFVGGGLGHGVGMSQTGSYYLARLGWGYDRILDFYFNGVSLQTLRTEFLAGGISTQ